MTIPKIRTLRDLKKAIRREMLGSKLSKFQCQIQVEFWLELAPNLHFPRYQITFFNPYLPIVYLGDTDRQVSVNLFYVDSAPYTATQGAYTVSASIQSLELAQKGVFRHTFHIQAHDSFSRGLQPALGAPESNDEFVTKDVDIINNFCRGLLEPLRYLRDVLIVSPEERAAQVFL